MKYMTDKLKVTGLDGVIAGETAISTLNNGLHYRGYAIEELARDATFTEVAYLLLHGELPTEESLADFRAILAESDEVPDAVIQLLHELPLHIAPIDVLRTSISALGHFDLQANENDVIANLGKAIRLLSHIPVLIAARYRLTRGLELVEPDSELSFAGNFLSLLHGRLPSARDERALERTLICYADHEFNASTFTARIVASTGSDLQSAVTAAVGALKGALHGGAIENVWEEIQQVQSPSDAERFVRDAISKKRRIAGFGHRVYRDCPDPRAELLKEVSQELATTDEQQQLEEIADVIEAAMWQHKQLRPNVDWPTARIYHSLGFDAELFTPLFAAARVIGWSAHFIEQQSANRLIQPRSNYVGAMPRPFVPLHDRG